MFSRSGPVGLVFDKIRYDKKIELDKDSRVCGGSRIGGVWNGWKFVEND